MSFVSLRPSSAMGSLFGLRTLAVLSNTILSNISYVGRINYHSPCPRPFLFTAYGRPIGNKPATIASPSSHRPFARTITTYLDALKECTVHRHHYLSYFMRWRLLSKVRYGESSFGALHSQPLKRSHRQGLDIEPHSDFHFSAAVSVTNMDSLDSRSPRSWSDTGAFSPRQVSFVGHDEIAYRTCPLLSICSSGCVSGSAQSIGCRYHSQIAT